MMAEKTIKGFYDYTEDELSTTIPKGTHCLKVSDFEVGEWDDGRPWIDFNTQVSGGEFDSKFGPKPRFTILLEDYEGITKGGKEFTANAEEGRKTFIKTITKMLDGKQLQIQNANAWDTNMLNQIGQQVKGAEFIATVDEDANGYMRIRRYYPMSSPPKSYSGVAGKKSFNLDDV